MYRKGQSESAGQSRQEVKDAVFRMMLAIETSRRRASLVMVENGVVRARRALAEGLSQGSGLVPLLAALLDETGSAAREIRAVAINVGPGSATGLRMGVALAQAFALAHPGTEFHAVPLEDIGLAALRREDPPGRAALLLEVAQGGCFFAQRYTKNGEWQKEGVIEVRQPQQINFEVASALLCGAGTRATALPAAPAPLLRDFPDAALVAATALTVGDYRVPIEKLAVRYLLPTSAEVLWERRRSGMVETRK